MDCRLSCELIAHAYAEQAPSSSARARLYLAIREAIIARRSRGSHWRSSSSESVWSVNWYCAFD